MAPIRKKKVWNFSFDIHSPTETARGRKKKRAVHARLRCHVASHQQETLRLASKEKQNLMRMVGALGWQQLLFVEPASDEQRQERQVMLRGLLEQRLSYLDMMLELYDKMVNNEMIDEVRSYVTEKNFFTDWKNDGFVFNDIDEGGIACVGDNKIENHSWEKIDKEILLNEGVRLELIRLLRGACRFGELENL